MPMTANCKQCGNIFQKKVHTQVFCGRPCQYAARMGENHPMYKGGHIDKGYRFISVNGRGVLEHRYVMEQHLGRQLTRNEEVHHKDGDRLNNTIDNLEIMTSREHRQHHTDYFRSETEKECHRCREVLPRDAFYITPTGLDTHGPLCKECCSRDAWKRNHGPDVPYTPRLRCFRSETERECSLCHQTKPAVLFILPSGRKVARCPECRAAYWQNYKRKQNN